MESLENTNFDLQERLVAIGSLVEAVRSEISDYCPQCEETVGIREEEVEEKEKVDFRLQENVIEGRLQLVMTGCSRIAEDLATLQHERDELQMVSVQLSCTYARTFSFHLLSPCAYSSTPCLSHVFHSNPFSLPILLPSVYLCNRAWRPRSSSLRLTQTQSLQCKYS